MLTAIVVDTNTDIDDGDVSTGNLSLREAVRLANEAEGADTITFDTGLAGSTITLTEGELEITSSITINGLGADQLTISGGGQTRVFTEVGNGPRIITITDVTIADGLAPSSTGGGVFFSNGAEVGFHRVVMTNNNSEGNNGSTIVAAFGTLEITDSAIVGNLNVGVGAIRLQDNATVITNTTISGNGTRGISVFNSSSNADSLSLTNVTIANNANEGVEVVAFASTTLLEYQNTIFANNGGQGSVDARGNDAGLPGLSIVSLGHNLLDDTPAGVAAHDAALGDLRDTDPLLAPLTDNDGLTPTHSLLAGSPAIDAGNSTLAIDQRGFARPFDVANVPNASGGNGSDIGAFEAFSLVPLAGDYDRSRTVDQEDYAVWRASFGAIGSHAADGNGDGGVDAADYTVWRDNLGATNSPAVAGLALALHGEIEHDVVTVQGPAAILDEMRLVAANADSAQSINAVDVDGGLDVFSPSSDGHPIVGAYSSEQGLSDFAASLVPNLRPNSEVNGRNAVVRMISGPVRNSELFYRARHEAVLRYLDECQRPSASNALEGWKSEFSKSQRDAYSSALDGLDIATLQELGELGAGIRDTV